MTRVIQVTAQFKRDYKRQLKRGKDMTVIKDAINRLARGDTLELKYRDHPLIGGYKGSRECHLEPDWLLLYELTHEELVLIRTGTHSDLFA